MSSTAELTGQIIAGKYRLDQVIGKGGFGAVYRGLHLAMERPVAIKVLTISRGDQGGVERFSQEARLVSQLQSPSTVSVFDYGVSEGTVYLVMEYIEGVTLKKFIQRHGALPVALALEFTLAILDSVEEAHHRGILHRDLKPANVMITKDFRGALKLKVLDFGIAKMMSDTTAVVEAPGELTSQQGFIGTPRYAAPEQLFNQGLGPVTDVYGVGMLLWEMLDAKPAVDLKTWGECSRFHIQHEKEPMRFPARAGVPAIVRSVVDRAVRRFVNQRYQSVAQMREDVERALAVVRGGGQEEVPRAAEEEERVTQVLAARGASVDPNLEDEAFEALFDSGGEQGVFFGAAQQAQKEVVRAPVRAERASERVARRGVSHSVLDERDWGESADHIASMEEAAPGRPVVREASRRAQVSSVRMQGGEAVGEPQRRTWQRGGGSKRRRASGEKVAALVLAASIVAVAVWWLSGGGEEEEDPLQAQALQEALQEEEDRFEVPQGRFSEEGIWLAVQARGWRRVSKVERIDLENVRASTAFYELGEVTLEVTLVEAKSEVELHELVSQVRDPTQVVRFDYRAIKIHPVKGKGMDEAASQLKEHLKRYRLLVVQGEQEQDSRSGAGER